uniref:Aldehyde oxidase n=1 Tax=Sphenodon punctatus TaxID=8508 RepID=A0A8D0L1Z4_SPHPU
MNLVYIVLEKMFTMMFEKKARMEVFPLTKALAVRLTGTKYGCGGGGCGACTVMLSRYEPVSKKILRHCSANACLIPICSLHCTAVTTVEGIGSTKTRVHPVQERLAKCHGSQCGFCTPGMVMSIYALLRNHPEPTLEQITEALAGNLCRFTGYRPIIDGCKTFCKEPFCCQNKEIGNCCLEQEEKLLLFSNQEEKLFSAEEFQPLDPTQELIFPPELLVNHHAPVGGGMRQISLCDIFADRLGSNTLNPEEILVSVHIPHSRKGEFVSAFRQAQRRENALPIVNAGMRVFFEEGDVIKEFSIFYGGVGCTTVSAKQTCQALLGRHWDEGMLDEACRLVLKEISLPGSAPGGKVEYRRTLIVSFLFKFYLEVLQSLKTMYPSRYPDIPEKYESALKNFRIGIPQSVQMYQVRQFPQDPVGRPIMHQSGINHATGEAVYCDDIRAVDEELSLAVVTSSRPHARIVSIDASEALKVPGVVDVISAPNVPAANEFYYFEDPEFVFARDKVICVGQVVCAVVADSDVHAKQAAAKVKIEYEPLEPLILTIEEAIRHNSFFEPQRKLEQGNVDEAFEIVDQILEGEIHIGGQEHFYMETQSVLVVPKGEDKEMDVYVSTQHPAFIQEMVASCLGVPFSRIMCHVKRIGGAFGGKLMKASLLSCIAAVAANKTGHAVRFILDRGNDMLITGGRHPTIGKYKVGFMNDGRILAVDVSYYFNGGCTPEDSILVWIFCVCKTNLPSNTAFRGFGFPQAGLVTESWIMGVAAKSGLSPQKIREINMYKEISQTHYKQELDPENLVRCWNECLEKSGYHSRRKAAEEFNKQSYWKKKGIAIIPMKFPFGFGKRSLSQAAALVHIYTDGSVLLTHGGIEMGQGIHTKMIQVASRELKIPMSNVYFCETSTTTIPNSCASVGSGGTDVNGMAVKDACQTLLKRLQPIISENPNGTWNEWVKEAFEQSINLSSTGYFRGYDGYMDWEKGEGRPFDYFLYGAACSEVEIDCLTGDHKNIRTDIVMDIGCSINPAVDIGQIEGAFVQGIGLYTMEELKYSPQGALYTRGPDQYKIPVVCDIPEQMSISLLSSSQNPVAIYSSKGLGESGLFLGCSVFFALWDAVAAVRQERGQVGSFVLNSPLSPEQIRMACADRFTEMVIAFLYLWPAIKQEYKFCTDGSLNHR